MATPVLNFNPQSFAQSNPFMQGMQTAAELPNTFAKAIFGPKMASQDLYKQQLANREASAQAQYAPENALSGMQLNQLKIPFTKAQTAHLEEETRLLPEQTRIALMNAMARQAAVDQSKARFGTNYIMTKLMQSPLYQQMVRTNPGVAENMMTAMQGMSEDAANAYVNNLNGAGQAPQGQGSGMPVNPAAASMPTQQGGSLPQKLGNMSMAPQGSPIAKGNGILPEKLGAAPTAPVLPAFDQDAVKAMQDVAGSLVIAKTVPSNIRSQLVISQNLDNSLQVVEPMLPQMSKYAGAVGTFNKKTQEFEAPFGMSQTDPNFVVFNNFMTESGPLIANELKRTLGESSSDAGREFLQGLATPQMARSNPTLWLSQMQTLIQIEHQVRKGLATSPNQVTELIKKDANKDYTPIGTPGNLTPEQKSSAAATGERVVVYRNGKAVTVPSSQLEDALKLPGVTRAP